MKFLIVGAGGVGGYFGARLAADGNDVTFVARGAHRDAMERRGLKVVSPLGDLHIERPQLHDDPLTTGLCDIALVCVKLWDTEAAAELIKPMLAHDTAVVSLQNGVTAERTLTEILGERHVLGGVAQIAARIAEPGVIEQTGRFARLVFGELNGQSSWRQECLLSACIGAAIDAAAAPDIAVEIWKKFVFLAPLAGATCFYRGPIGEVLADPARRGVLESLVGETVAVARAEGVALSPETEARVMERLGGLPAEMKASMLHDLEAGRRLELDWLNGAVVRLGRELGVATPANAEVTETLAPYAMGGGA
jgi:2-dehydropantoate 2-reductase